jgi:hypothetical protein
MAKSHTGPVEGGPKKPDEKKLTVNSDTDLYELHKTEIALVMGHFFLRYLNLLYREFEGDLVLPIVLGEIAHHNVFRYYSSKGSSIRVLAELEQLNNHSERLQQLESTNAYSISVATGIPRETVRRKIAKLENKGWLIKTDRGEVFLSDKVRDQFSKNLNKRILAELLTTAERIRHLTGSEGYEILQQGE